MDELSFYWTIASYFIVIALIIAGYVLLRKFLRIGGMKMRGGGGFGSAMKIKERVVVAQDKQIILLEVKDKIMMIGITPQSMANLAEFEKNEFEAADDGDSGVPQNGGSFLNQLSEKFKTGFGKVDKIDKNDDADETDEIGENENEDSGK